MSEESQTPPSEEPLKEASAAAVSEEATAAAEGESHGEGPERSASSDGEAMTGEQAGGKETAESASDGRTRFKIRIGASRRTAESATAHPPAAEASATEATEATDASSASPTPPSESPAPLVPPAAEDVDAEMEAVLAGGSVESLLEQATSSVTEIPLETRQRATVVRHDNEHVFFSLGGPNEGAAPLRHFEAPPEPGAEFDVIVTGHNSEDNLYELSIPGASVEVADWTDITEGAVVEVRVTGTNTGGLECKLNESIRGFIPASQIALYRVENFNEFLDRKLVCVVTQISKKGRHKSVVLSHRAILEREKEEERKKKLEELEVGQVVEGVVRNIRDFGAFVDIGGLDGLLHVSQLSWERVNHPSEVLELGQKIRVKVEKVNKDSGKISLSYKALTDHPWTNADQRFPAQSTVTGTVSRIANFGAFVKLAPGVEGMIHISELAHRRVGRVEDVVQEGQEVTCKVLSVDPENQRMALSLKALEAEPQPDEPPAEAEQKPRQRRKQSTNLKGGLDRPAGGEKFGLKW